MAVVEFTAPPGLFLRKKAQYYIGGTKDRLDCPELFQIIRSTGKTDMNATPADDRDAVMKRLMQREAVPLWVKENIRFIDMDVQGHVNNAYYSTYFEVGRVATRPALAARAPGSVSVIAEQTIRYLLPLSYPATIDIGTAVTRIGRSSYDLGHTIFLGDRCAATGILIYVLTDPATGKGMPLNEEFRARLEEIRLREPS